MTMNTLVEGTLKQPIINFQQKKKKKKKKKMKQLMAKLRSL